MSGPFSDSEKGNLFSARQDPDNATHAAGYCVNTSELKESCVTLQGAPNTYACSKLGTGMLLCGSEEVAALTDAERCIAWNEIIIITADVAAINVVKMPHALTVYASPMKRFPTAWNLIHLVVV